MSLGKEVSILYAVTNGYLDDVPVAKIATFEEGFHRFMESNKPEILRHIEADKEIKAETEQVLKAAIAEYKQLDHTVSATAGTIV